MSVRERDEGSAIGNGRRRRRQWSAAEKRRIVAEADEPRCVQEAERRAGGPAEELSL
jgi:transposase-like protein